MIIIQARMGSNRLQGKSLIEIKDKSILEHTLDAVLNHFDRSKLVVATSSKEESLPIIELCKKLNVLCFLGDEENVASRFQQILKKHTPKYFIRLNADSPLMDAQAIIEADKLIQTGMCDLVTTKGGNFPSGANVEALNTEIFLREYANFNSQEHFEHVTKYFYDHKDKFKIHPLLCPVADAANIKLSVDTPEDLEKIKKVFSKMARPHYTYSLKEKCMLYRETS